MAAAASADATDERLVAAARAGSDEAFETLFRRYGDRIKAHVWGMLGDEGRAEDVTQEAFISALRRLRATDQQIAFKPWIYQIARNACIDHLRRLKRADEISIDSDDFGPGHERRLSQEVSGTESTVSQREEINNLRQAFGGLPDSQHKVLVLREFEGLSYEEIGQRMNLTAPAVESMLFRARRGLKGEYQDISTGARCRNMQAVIAKVSEGIGGRREKRMLVRHVQECTSCRREAAAMGIGGLAVHDRRRGRALSRVAALLPFPPFLHRRGTASGEGANGALAGTARKLSELGPLGSVGAEQAASAAQKAVAVIAALAVVGGGGIVAQKSGAGGSDSPAVAAGAGSGAGGTLLPGARGGAGGVFGAGGGLNGLLPGGGGAGGGAASPTANGFGGDPFGGGLGGFSGPGTHGGLTPGSGAQGSLPGASAPGGQLRLPQLPSSSPKPSLPGSSLRLPDARPPRGGEPLLPGEGPTLPPVTGGPRKPSVDLPPIKVSPPSGKPAPPPVNFDPPPVPTPRPRVPPPPVDPPPVPTPRPRVPPPPVDPPPVNVTPPPVQVPQLPSAPALPQAPALP
jgi:RNA polymerase sigma factor (sigma-70 family)